MHMPRGARDFFHVVALSLLAGFTVGAGLALLDLSQFARVPTAVGFALLFISGALIGASASHLSHALAAFLLMIPISAAVNSLALAYPEFQVDRLGTEIALEISVMNAFRNVIILAIPLCLVGLLIGKALVRE